MSCTLDFLLYDVTPRDNNNANRVDDDSVVECLTRDRGITGLWSMSKTFILA